MLDSLTGLIIVATFLIAGAVKGVIGLGLPTVALALLTVAIDLPSAMAVMLVPSLATNVWQALAGGEGRALAARLWPFLLTAGATVWIGAAALTRVDLALLSALLGVLLIVYSLLNLAGLRLEFTSRQEVWAGPLAGLANGILTGMTGTFVMPGVLFLQAIGLSRDMLVQAMGMLFTVSTLALGLALRGNGMLTGELAAVSAAALVPAIIGMVAGQRIRRALPEALFRRIFFMSLLALGGYIATSALGGLG